MRVALMSGMNGMRDTHMSDGTLKGLEARRCSHGKAQSILALADSMTTELW